VSKPPAPAATASKAAPKTSKAATAAAPAAAPAAKAASPKATAPKAVPKPETKALTKTPAPAPAPAPVAAAPAKVLTRTASKAAPSKAAKAANTPPMPALAPEPLSSNRFTDRFAPARHAARDLMEPHDAHKAALKADPKLANAWKSKPGRELSEPELLAMPEAEYMNDKQLDFFRARLQQQKDDLLSNAGETTEHLREDTSIVPDPADRATIEEEHALELRTRDRERKLLKKVAQSLARLDTGEYGYCDETGEPIGLARLLARPTATLSLEAQQRRELKQKMFGD
jgi:DnaK suppressor protein